MYRTIRTGVLAMAGLVGFLAMARSADHTKDTLESVKKSVAEGKAIIIDVREKAEWDEGHIEGALFVPLSKLKESGVPKDLPKDKIIYTHCKSGGRCLLATDILLKAGYDVRALKNGYSDLIKEGFPKAK